VHIEIKNCNNIDSGVIQIVENHLNIKYAINGTGKSTISKAICNSVMDRKNGTNKLSELNPFKAVNDSNIKPTVTGTESIKSVKIFDESYVNEFIFQPDELLRGSFDIFIRSVDYDAGINAIETLVAEVKTLLSEDGEIEGLISDFNELSGSFGKPTKSGIHGSSSLAKALKEGNKITNIPEELEIYKDYIQDSNNFKWIKWQLDGKLFIDITDNCPYCVNDIVAKKETIKKVGEVYEVKVIENLNKIIAVFLRLNKYFSDRTKMVIDDFIKNVDGYTDDQVDYLKEVKEQVDRLNEKFGQAKNIGFFSFKDVDEVIERLKTYIIDIKLYNHLQSEGTLEKVTNVNKSIAQLLQKASELQGKINIQKRLIEKLVNENKETINSFLRNAGYRYKVDLIEDEKGKHKLKLIHVDLENEVKDVKACLSYGEQNAFALVLFMFDALKNQPDLVVLDDPISSFDKNKKYAIVEMLFRSEDYFRGKTVLLLSHDFEPIVDMVYHHSDRFEKPFATFIENNYGLLSEREIKKIDIQTFIEINAANISNGRNIVSKLVYLRRTYEITNAKGMSYQLISNVLHKRSKPSIFDTALYRLMTPEEIAEGAKEVKQKIPEFDYADVIKLVSDDSKLKDLYKQSSNNYEKLHIYRILFDGKDETIQSDIIQKFINQAFHIENDYIYQLNPATFQAVPQYVIDECDRFVKNE
jgi:ABC-type lipoprotein export system ATPase subunit